MKILFLDIDGTVLSHTTNTIPSSALKAINTVRKQGIKVFGCTGRHTLELEKLPLEHLEVDGWITMNGAYNYTESCVISSYPIERQDIHALYDFLKKESFPVQFLEAKYMYMNMHSSLVEKVWKRFIKVMLYRAFRYFSNTACEIPIRPEYYLFQVFTFQYIGKLSP